MKVTPVAGRWTVVDAGECWSISKTHARVLSRGCPRAERVKIAGLNAPNVNGPRMTKANTDSAVPASPTAQPTGKAPAQLMAENGYYYFADEFNLSTTAPIIQWIIGSNLKPEHERLANLTLIINSPGGRIDSCMALIDTMKGSAIPVNTVGLGSIASCGVMTFMAGVVRSVTPNTQIMSHRFSSGSFGKEHELFARVRGFELTQKTIMRHYKKCTGLSKKAIKKYLLPPEDVFLSAEEAVKYGLADRIVTTY